MPRSSGTLTAAIRLIAAQTDDRPDEVLLGRFVADRDEAAFRTIVRRHGGMVLDVCRSVLRNDADAEDAFQAVFLILSTSAHAVRTPAALPGWLHAAACRTARKVRLSRQRRQGHEARAPAPTGSVPSDPSWAEVRQAIHEEVNRLPERYRVAVVLFYLTGLTQADVGAALGLTKDGAKKRLERGRELLRVALDRRGFGTAALLGAATVAPSSPPAALTTATSTLATQYATGTALVPPAIQSLVTNGSRTMLNKLSALATSLLVVAAAIALGVYGIPAQDAPKSDRPAPPAKAVGRAEPDVPLPGKDLDRLQGKWVSIACEMDGTQFAGKQLEDFHFDPTFDGNRHVIQFGTIRMEGTFELDPTRNPKTITLTLKDRPDGRINPGIYDFDGDRLRICVADSINRPTEFKTKAGTGHSLIVFERLPREREVREAADGFLKAALTGDTRTARALTAPAVSDQQIARFKGLARGLRVTSAYVTTGPAPSSQGCVNAGRALVVTEDVEVTDGRGKSKGRVVLTLLKDDERARVTGWQVWDIDLSDAARVAQEVTTFHEHYAKEPARKGGE